MRGELVKTATSDGLVLDGFLVRPPRRGTSVLIYIHGLGSNFYRHLDQDLVGKLRSSATAVLWVNTRGHDTVAKIATTAADKRTTVGAAHERLSDAYRDIEAWIQKAKRIGFKGVFLLGHSLGAVKVGLYIRRGKSLANVVGAAYASPPDMWNENYRATRQKEGVTVAKRLLRAGKGGSLMPKGFMHYEQTVASYLDKMDPARKNNIFDFINGDFGWAKKFKRPQLLIYGDHDEPIKNDDSRTAIAVFLVKVPHANAIRIRGASHNYAGKRHVFYGIVARWIRSVLGNKRATR